MPADFMKCISDGGKIWTVTGPNKKFGLKKNQYRKFCSKGGKTYSGETKTKLKPKKK